MPNEDEVSALLAVLRDEVFLCHAPSAYEALCGESTDNANLDLDAGERLGLPA